MIDSKLGSRTSACRIGRGKISRSWESSQLGEMDSALTANTDPLFPRVVWSDLSTACPPPCRAGNKTFRSVHRVRYRVLSGTVSGEVVRLLHDSHELEFVVVGALDADAGFDLEFEIVDDLDGQLFAGRDDRDAGWI